MAPTREFAINAPTGLAGNKRSASPALPPENSSTSPFHQPVPQHEAACDHACPDKRRRTSEDPSSGDLSSSHVRRPPSVIWHDFGNREDNQDHGPSHPMDEIRNIMAKAGVPLTSTPDSNRRAWFSASTPDKRLKELNSHIVNMEAMEKTAESRTGEETRALTEREEAVESYTTTVGGDAQEDELGRHSKARRIHNFYTAALILTAGGIVGPERVEVDERSESNLLPRSMAVDLGLIRYLDRTSEIMIADRLVQTNEYCQFTIRVAGVHTTINASVIPGLHTILLGSAWIRSVDLLRESRSQRYYIAVPLPVDLVTEKFPESDEAQVETRKGGAAASHQANSDDGTVEYGDDKFFDGERLLGDHPLSGNSSDREDGVHDEDEEAEEAEEEEGEKVNSKDDQEDRGSEGREDPEEDDGDDEEDEEEYEDYEDYEGCDCEDCECEECECEEWECEEWAGEERAGRAEASYFDLD